VAFRAEVTGYVALSNIASSVPARMRIAASSNPSRSP
jgi:hypothetical protein